MGEKCVCVCDYVFLCVCVWFFVSERECEKLMFVVCFQHNGYRVAKTHRLPYIYKGFVRKRDLQKRPIFCKETYIFKHPTNRSHPIPYIYMVLSAKEPYN